MQYPNAKRKKTVSIAFTVHTHNSNNNKLYFLCFSLCAVYTTNALCRFQIWITHTRTDITCVSADCICHCVSVSLWVENQINEKWPDEYIIAVIIIIMIIMNRIENNMLSYLWNETASSFTFSFSPLSICRSLSGELHFEIFCVSILIKFSFLRIFMRYDTLDWPLFLS